MNIRTVPRSTIRHVTVSVPGSKSYTNRALVAAALADGESIVSNASPSIDTKLLVDALGEFGVQITRSGTDLTVRGCGGRFGRADRTLFLGNAGTSVRFLAAMASLLPGTTILCGDADMDARPMADLISALQQAGVGATSEDGHTPLKITGGTLRGGRIMLDGSKSSQFLSSLLLVAPYADEGLEIVLTTPVSSKPYVDMTMSVMKTFGASVGVERGVYRVGPARYTPAVFPVETDVSGSTFFASAAAITGATVTLPGVSAHTLQGDLAFFRHLERMGCRVVHFDDRTEITGPPVLRGVTADLNEVPDSVPPLAVTAAFARGETVLSRIGHLKFKESDRLAALATELPKLGAVVERSADGLVIIPGTPRPALIETYRDHRIAMSFAVAGLRTGGMDITHPGCVDKSYPGFWEQIEKFT